MDRTFHFDKVYEKINFSEKQLSLGDYEGCTFTNCHFENANIAEINFTECEFVGCNLSMANISRTTFKDAKFSNCKMLGLHFENCNDILFSVDFNNCSLNLSSFYKLKLKSTQFNGCSLQEVDFSQANLQLAKFINCDLKGAIFENTNLEKADFTSAYNYSFDPEINLIKKAKFSTQGVIGLLSKYGIEIE